MKILGISGSSRSAEVSGTHKLVEKVLEATGCDYELVSLKGKTISGCTGCLGCVEDNVCKVQDDMGPLRQKVAEAYKSKWGRLFKNYEHAQRSEAGFEG